MLTSPAYPLPYSPQPFSRCHPHRSLFLYFFLSSCVTLQKTACTLIPLFWDRQIIFFSFDDLTDCFPFPPTLTAPGSYYIQTISPSATHRQNACSTPPGIGGCFCDPIGSQHSTQYQGRSVVDCDIEEDKPHQEAFEQRATTFPMPDGDTIVAVSHMDVVLADASSGSRCRTHQG